MRPGGPNPGTVWFLSRSTVCIRTRSLNTSMRTPTSWCGPATTAVCLNHLGLAEGTVRASLAIYNTQQEVDLFVASIGEICRRIQESAQITFPPIPGCRSARESLDDNIFILSRTSIHR